MSRACLHRRTIVGDTETKIPRPKSMGAQPRDNDCLPAITTFKVTVLVLARIRAYVKLRLATTWSLSPCNFINPYYGVTLKVVSYTSRCLPCPARRRRRGLRPPGPCPDYSRANAAFKTVPLTSVARTYPARSTQDSHK